MWNEEPGREALFGFLLAAGVALGLLVALYGVLWLRWAIGASPVPGIEGLAVFALIHGGAASAEVPPIPALFGLGGSVKIGLPATTLVLLPFLALLVGGWAVARQVRALWLFVAVAAISYTVLVAVVALFGSASFEGGEGVTVRLSVDPVSSGLRAFLWAGLGTMLGVSAARGPLLPDGVRQVLKGAFVAVGASVALTLVLALGISLFGGAPDVPTQGLPEGLGQPTKQPQGEAPDGGAAEGPTGEPGSGGSGIGGLLAAMGALFAFILAALGNLWLLAHGLPVGFRDVPDLGSVPLLGEALKDVPLRFGLLGEWPFGGAWRLLLVAPIAGLVLGGVVAARGAAARPLQGASVAVPYTVIAALAAVLFGLDASVSVAALDVDLSFGASLAWMALLLPVAAGLGALGGLVGWRGAVPVARPRRTTLVTGAASAIVMLLTLPVALVPLSGGNAAPEVPVEDPPIADVGPEPTTTPEPEETSVEPEPTTEPEPTASGSPDAPPDPMFDALLPTLQESTTARIMLPAGLPEELSNVAVDSDSGGDEYGILFLTEPTGNVVEDYVHAYDVGTIRSTPDPQEVSEEFFDASREETVELPDGTEATLRYLEPSAEGGNAGPFWEGRFEKDGQTYILSIPLADPDGEIARGLLTSMVEVPGSEEASVEQQFISEYYAAVGRENWAATYSMLDATSSIEFTEEEWVRKQQAREAASDAAPVESATIAEISGEGAGFSATVNLAYEGSTEATIPGVAVYFEDGEFKRHLTEEDLAFLEDF